MKIWGAQIIGGLYSKLVVANMAGNEEVYAVENVQKNPDSALDGKKIIYLGSSVTEGSAACGSSFVDYLQAKDGVTPLKEAVSGTTLVTLGDTSYIPRMKTIDKEFQADAFICQLSTNDASKGLELGMVSDSMDREDFNTDTVVGAMEYIISYARETWDCPVIFYTGSRYDSEDYGKMVELLYEVQKKWDCGVIDLWNDEEFNNITDEQRALYILSDGIHPTQAGYLKWWLPKFEDYLKDYLDE